MKLLLTVLVLFLVSPRALSQESASPGFYEPLYFETMPGVRFYLFQDEALWQNGTLSVEHHATADCLTPPVALEMAFPPIDASAGIMRLYLGGIIAPEVERATLVPSDAIGLSFWLKGDGSAGTGILEITGEEGQAPAVWEFPLADKTWRRVFLKWSDLSPAADPAKVAYIGWSLKSGSPRPSRFIVDNLRLEKTAEPDAALAALAEAANALPAGSRGAAPVQVRPSPSSCSYNKGALASARAKLRERSAQKWLVYGDSVSVPVQLWNIPESLHRSQYAYYAVAANMLRKEYGAPINVVVNAVGGRTLEEHFSSLLDSLSAEKPDVLILQSTATAAEYALYLPQVLAAAKASGTEVLLMTATYDVPPFRNGDYYWAMRWAVENNVACADTRSYLLGVPEPYWGDIVANPYHPNALGHRLIGQAIAEMFR